MFQLTKEEAERILSKFQIETLKDKRGNNIKYLPYAFTEQGVSMLATVIKTEVAEEISIAIIDAFVSMRHFIKENEYLLDNLINIRNQVDDNKEKLLKHDIEINKLFSKFETKIKNEMIYFDGQIFDAYSKIISIMSQAKKELIIIDSYADLNVLNMLTNIKAKVLLITKSSGLLKKQDIEHYNKQYKNLKVVYNNIFHDRYIIIDKKAIYHCGSSLNYVGTKTFGINELKELEIIDLLLKKIESIMYNL